MDISGEWMDFRAFTMNADNKAVRVSALDNIKSWSRDTVVVILPIVEALRNEVK
ncbi:hypothetical protein BDV12DRAFT_163494 [Aspergillus spectabilis]